MIDTAVATSFKKADTAYEMEPHEFASDGEGFTQEQIDARKDRGGRQKSVDRPKSKIDAGKVALVLCHPCVFASIERHRCHAAKLCEYVANDAHIAATIHTMIRLTPG